jgi:hypothetical protein
MKPIIALFFALAIPGKVFAQAGDTNRKPAASISCTARVSEIDCIKASHAFSLRTGYTEQVEVEIADPSTFDQEKERAAYVNKMVAQECANKFTGRCNRRFQSSYEMEKGLLILFGKDSIHNPEKIIVSTDAFYYLNYDDKGNPKGNVKQFQVDEAVRLASEVNGFINGWTLGRTDILLESVIQ